MLSRIRIIEVLMLVIAVSISAGWIIDIAPMNREAARISVCHANLRGIGSSMYIYAGETDENFPMSVTGPRNGEMNLFGYRTRPPDPADAPSPSADLWLMLRAHNNAPNQFVCPSSTDTADPIQDTTTAFDFAGPKHLSYAYAYQYHPQRRALHTGSDPRIPLAADANPYLKGGLEGSVNADRLSIGAGNSRNHRIRRGQCVLFVDSGVDFMKTPRTSASPAGRYAATSMPADNIYTTHADNEAADPGNAPTWTRIQIGSKSDYCLVP